MSRNLDCKFILDGKNFIVKDNKTSSIFLNGTGSDGLYYLNPTNSKSYNEKSRELEKERSTILE